MEKKNRILIFSIFALFLCLKMASAYIDPGTGGYLATTLWSTISVYVAILFAAIAAFVSTYFFRPIKHFFIKHKKKAGRILLVCVVIFIGAIIYNYISKTPKFDPTLSGAHIYEISKSYGGYNLYEGKLVDMQGNLIKKWNSTYLGVIDKNGDYYADKYYDAPIWGRYSWNDTVIWEMNLPIHHEILLTPENTIITFTKKMHEYNGRKVEFDVILEFAKNGTLIEKWSTWDNLKYLQQFHKPLELDQPSSFLINKDNKKNMSIWGGEYDYYHLNSISLVPNNSLQGTHPAFNPGNWLISFRHGSMIFILDKDTKQVLWRAIYDQVSGNIEGPHTPSMTSNGNIIVFDNGRYREWSRIIEINPSNYEILWEYRDKNFFTHSEGYVQKLENGNYLVTESEKGRVFELTPEKEIVWEFYHPDKQDETNSLHPESYETRQWIYRMIKYEKSFIDGLMKGESLCNIFLLKQ